MTKIVTIYLCINNNKDIVAHAVKTDNGIVIGSQLGASHEGKHKVAKDIQKVFKINPMQHAMLLNNAIFVNEKEYQALLDSCTPITWEEAVKRI